jgi:hypothetical protein
MLSSTAAERGYIHLDSAGHGVEAHDAAALSAAVGYAGSPGTCTALCTVWGGGECRLAEIGA